MLATDSYFTSSQRTSQKSEIFTGIIEAQMSEIKKKVALLGKKYVPVSPTWSFDKMFCCDRETNALLNTIDSNRVVIEHLDKQLQNMATIE